MPKSLFEEAIQRFSPTQRQAVAALLAGTPDLWERMKVVCRTLGISYGDVARATDLDYRRVERIMNLRARPTGEEILRITTVLGVQVDD